MKNAPRSIFRTDAVHRYLEGKEKPVLPQFIAPRTALYLWVLLGLLGVSGGIVCFTTIPTYVAGSALVVAVPAESPASSGVAVVAFLPAERLSYLGVGQRIFLGVEAGGKRQQLRVTAVKPVIMSPELVQREFDLDASAVPVITQPAAVVIAAFESPSALPAATYLGSRYPVDVEVGSRRLVSLLPLLKRGWSE